MSKKGTKALASATLLSLVLTTALSAGPVKAADANLTAAGKVTRTSGVDRYETAAKVATTNWDKGSKDVVLVCGEGYADAVSGSVLAKTIDAPILLTQSKTLSADTKKALDTLKPENVYVIGGTASIAQSVRDGLKTSGYNLKELGGANRYETNVAVANELVKNHGVKADNVMVVGGEGFSDALSVAPVAAAKGQILLLGSNSQSDMKSVINFVNDNKSKATVVGTNNVMNDSILKALGVDTSARINGGADRFATNLNVLNTFKDDLKADKLYVANATADDGYADALVASALAGKVAAPLVLVDTDSSTATQNALDYISTKANSSTDLNVVGGTGVVSSALEQKINDAIDGNVNPGGDTTVKSVESVGLNQIKVVFNTDVDSDSAEDVGNYKINGITLNDNGTKNGGTADANSATATLQDDNKTVLITLAKAKEQQKDYTISVKDGILTEDKQDTVEEKEQSVTFGDTEAPTVSSVSVKGNSKLTVKFSEPVRVEAEIVDGKIVPKTGFISNFKINDRSITNEGISLNDCEVKNAIQEEGNLKYYLSDEVDFYFTGKLDAGSNVLKVEDGKANDSLSDTAGFTVKEQEQDFNVDTVSTKPQVKEVTCDSDDTVWVRFDRPMDSKTAVDAGYYKVNNKELTDDGELKEDDYTVKFKHVKNIETGSNTIYITDDVKDAYGNTVDDDTRVNFTKSKDEEKPQVNNVKMVDSETIRVTFNKDILASYAKQLSNYKLKDSDGLDISDNIRVVEQANKNYSDTTTPGAISDDDTDVWDIKMDKNHKLNSSKYSLTIKNLRDTSSDGNVMDEKTFELNGNDDTAPKMEGAIKTDDKTMLISFSEAMDSSSLKDLSNYKYVNDSNESKTLPSDTDVTVGDDNKSVKLEFPDSYKMVAEGETASSDVDEDNIVRGIVASGLKDEAGNIIDSFSNAATLGKQSADTKFGIKNNSVRVESDGNDVVVYVQFTKSVNMDTLTNESVDKSITFAGIQPDAIGTEGSNIKLTFSNGNKVKNDDGSNKTVYSAYKEASAADSAAGLKESVTTVTDEANNDSISAADYVKLYAANGKLSVGKDVQDILGGGYDNATDTTNNKVYDYNVAPETTTSDYWYAAQGTTSSAVVLTFDTALDADNSSVKKDDYTFFVGGKQVYANDVVIKGNSVVFKFDKDAFADGDGEVSVRLKDSAKSTIDIEAAADADTDTPNAKYVPSDDDMDSNDVDILNSSDVKTWVDGLLK
ncbi:cell wall-binding repeat-containing protein [Clostridium sp. JN-1]|uniref:cell wall-binding repeat-containing protein n=1 Tax=Clostridium sp. JN-1 TaxID=2483110 RepID=UPI000F0B9480|nr:cell wall-binding repeat-containing protein [Clostridium sp. JN-1]